MHPTAPSTPPTVAEIAAAIGEYARAYAALEILQRRAKEAPPAERLLPLGDQKTGAIGEFYARLYLGARHPHALISFAGHGERGWDLEVHAENGEDRPHRVQVKCVSPHSRTRRLSPIHNGWDELLVLALDDRFAPAGLWVITATDAMPSTGVLPYCCAPDPWSVKSTGSTALPFGPNRVAGLVEVGIAIECGRGEPAAEPR